MKIIESMKAILKEHSRDHCFQQMKKHGRTSGYYCIGKTVENYPTKHLSHKCVNCSYLFAGFKPDNIFYDENLNIPVECPCCQKGEPLVETLTSDFAGIMIQGPNLLTAYGYDIRKNGCSRIAVKINYCPMCGGSLKL